MKKHIQSMLITTALAFSSAAALAQGTVPADTAAPATAAPSAAPPQMRIVAPTNDPLVQRREDNAVANEEYKNNKKQAKQAYKQKVKAAKTDQKQLKRDASQDAKAALADQPQRNAEGTAQQ